MSDLLAQDALAGDALAGTAAEHARCRASAAAGRFAPARAAATRGKAMLAVVAAILVVLWLCGLLIFKAAGGLIHILLVIAVIAVVLHFVRGRAAP
jgi:uncharacterized protein DUF5670